MPLVAPIIGLRDAAWVDAWWDAGTRLGVDWGKVPFGPLVRAPSREGTLMCRRCSFTEASSILVTALDLDPKAGVSSHSLKATTLVWGGRRGFPEREALLLGHHTTGQNSHAVYARELLSAPLRLYASMLLEVKSGKFRPDTTRSGWLDESARVVPASQDFAAEVSFPQLGAGSANQDYADSFYEPSLPSVEMPEGGEAHKSPPVTSCASSFECVGEPGEAEGPFGESCHSAPEPCLGESEAAGVGSEGDETSASSSSSTTSSESEGEAEENTLGRAGVSQAFEVEGPLWQHVKTKMLHKAAGSEQATRTKCGRRTGNAYVRLPGAMARWPRCSLCFKHEIIANKGDLL